MVISFVSGSLGEAFTINRSRSNPNCHQNKIKLNEMKWNNFKSEVNVMSRSFMFENSYEILESVFMANVEIKDYTISTIYINEIALAINVEDTLSDMKFAIVYDDYEIEGQFEFLGRYLVDDIQESIRDYMKYPNSRY